MTEFDDFLARTGLAPAHLGRHWTALTGGVSSDIWRADLEDGRTLCVKRALAKLNVAADWEAPVSRNSCEWAWIRFAASVLPSAVPVPLAHDANAGMFAMSFLSPQEHPVWKHQLLNGHINPATAAAVGQTVSLLHQAASHRTDLAAVFDTGNNFYALRLEPYLLATAQRHPELATRLMALAQCTATTKTTLIHGDISPKNILVGPTGPVILDAECAWYGDPAFDVAFCLNHLLLKSLPQLSEAAALATSFQAWTAAYFAQVKFERRETLEARAAALLPALLLARIDGKSPVEYVTTDSDRDVVRSIAIPLVAKPVQTLAEVASLWFRGIP